MPSSHLILCCPFLLLPPIPPSIRVFSNESTLRMRWPKYWSFSFSIFQRTPRADLLYNGLVGSPCSPRDSQESSPTPQFKSISSLVLSFLHSPTLTSTHMTNGKMIALTRRTFVGKVMSLLFNMLSRLDIAFLPRCKRLLISWLQSPPALYLPKSLLLLPLSEVPRDAGLDVVERWGRCARVLVFCGVRVGVLVCGRSLL